jgi:hypothetical protein
VDEVARWLDAAAARPVAELLMIRRGPKKGALEAKVRPAVLERARQVGLDRQIAYLVTIWTGLRRSELEQLEWRDVALGGPVPHLSLRAEATKSDRSDPIPVHWQLAEELAAYRPVGARPRDRVLPVVPDMKVMKLDLAFAGINYGNREIGFADLHSMRMTLNTMLAAQGVNSRSRQAQLRHNDPRLTEITYFDQVKFVQPHAREIGKALAIPTRLVNLPTEESKGVSGAALAQQTGGSAGPLGALRGTVAINNSNEGGEGRAESEGAVMSRVGTERHDPASCDTGPFEKRAKGIEPSTFTLAT